MGDVYALIKIEPVHPSQPDSSKMHTEATRVEPQGNKVLVFDFEKTTARFNCIYIDLYCFPTPQDYEGVCTDDYCVIGRIT